MSHIRIPKSWEIPEHQATPRDVYLNRRQWLKAAGLTLGAIAGPGCGLSVEGVSYDVQNDPLLTPRSAAFRNVLPAPRNDLYAVDERPLTPAVDAASYNNYYEFTTNKSQVWQVVGGFEPDPWRVRIHGEVEQETTLDLDDIARRFPLEQRVYRHRCVERWAMTVPWDGFPLRDLLAVAAPLSSARYVRFTTLSRPEQQPGIDERPRDPWPYFEALTIEEADLDLTFVVLGLYGEPLPAQNGSPLRLAVPWKYGYKSIKAIVDIELVAEQPPTFWNTLNAREYGFYSNVNPSKPHPRWSQAEEWLIPDTGNRVPTMLYNGYGEEVSFLYRGDED